MFFTSTISGYVDRRLKRNRRANPDGDDHFVAVEDAVAEVAIAAANDPNASAAAIEVVRRQRPPQSVSSIFL